MTVSYDYKFSFLQCKYIEVRLLDHLVSVGFMQLAIDQIHLHITFLYVYQTFSLITSLCPEVTAFRTTISEQSIGVKLSQSISPSF